MFILSSTSRFFQVCVLAGMTRRLDKDTLNKDSFLSGENEPTALSYAYDDLSVAMSLFSHNIIVNDLLLQKHQDTLLLCLQIAPSEEYSEMPLLVLPRSLLLLAHTLLLRQNASDQSGLHTKSNSYALMWDRLLRTLSDNVVRPEIEDYSEKFDDLNVEHAQLMVKNLQECCSSGMIHYCSWFQIFFFHSLSLLQKKQILLSAANYICKALREVKAEGKTMASLSKSRVSD